MIGIHQIRWLSRGAALIRFCVLYAGVVAEMEADSRSPRNETAKELLVLLTSHAFVATLCGMTDIIARVHALSRLFQATAIRYEEVRM